MDKIVLSDFNIYKMDEDGDTEVVIFDADTGQYSSTYLATDEIKVLRDFLTKQLEETNG